MENATKALLIAGGVLLAMLLIAVLIFAWGQFSEYYNNTQSLADIDDITNFNMQFTNYEGRDVYGYELISLANLVADYNFRYSSYSTADPNDKAQNDKYYTPITMNITINDAKVIDFYFGDGNYAPHIFTTGHGPYQQSSTRNDIQKIINTATGIENFYRNKDVTAKLAKSINSLLAAENVDQVNYYVSHGLTEEEAKNRLQNEGTSKYKAITGRDVSYNEMKNEIINTANIKQYYEYYQFKKAIFKCDINSITYDSVSQRVNSISFTYNKMG